MSTTTRSERQQQELSGLFMQMVNLTYKRFIAMIEELNDLTKYFIDDDGSTLEFRIIKGTDATFLWKITVRIECSKLSVEDSDIRGYRILRLNQFINLYYSIKQQAETMKHFNHTSDSATETTGTTSCAIMNDKSKLYDSILVTSANTQNASTTGGGDEEVCCICMERKPNLILPCTHNYCESCIKEWHVTNLTCPICRCESGENDAFVLADKPDYYNLQDEMSKSLFEITKNPKASIKRFDQVAAHSSTSDSD